MWPWEHAIVGYVAYSLCCHAAFRDSPNGLEAVAIAFASVLPDLIDKPLAWEYGVLESGYGVGHSVFFAVPLAIIVGLVARRADRPRAGLAFAASYLLHLPSDVLDGYLREGVLHVGVLLWPVRRTEGSPPDDGFFDAFTTLFAGYRGELLSGDPSAYVLALFGLTACAVALWVYDGAPPVPEAISVASGVAVRARARFIDQIR